MATLEEHLGLFIDHVNHKVPTSEQWESLLKFLAGVDPSSPVASLVSSVVGLEGSIGNLEESVGILENKECVSKSVKASDGKIYNYSTNPELKYTDDINSISLQVFDMGNCYYVYFNATIHAGVGTNETIIAVQNIPSIMPNVATGMFTGYLTASDSGKGCVMVSVSNLYISIRSDDHGLVANDIIYCCFTIPKYSEV